MRTRVKSPGVVAVAPPEAEPCEVATGLRMGRLFGRAQVATPEFKSWFGKSKVVDHESRPLVVFHGTNQPIEAFDPERRGASTVACSAKEGDFFTDNPEEASDYAGLAAERVIAGISAHERKTEDLMRRMDRAERQRKWDLHQQILEELEEHELGAMRQGPVGACVLPVWLSIQNPREVEVGGTITTGEVREHIRTAKAEGQDGLILWRIRDGIGPGPLTTHFVVFEPTQVKSAIGNNGEFDLRKPGICS